MKRHSLLSMVVAASVSAACGGGEEGDTGAGPSAGARGAPSVTPSPPSPSSSPSPSPVPTEPPPSETSPPVSPTPPTTKPIDVADMLGRARADVPFAQQSGFTAQVIGTYTSASKIPETGITGSVLPSGETLRFGKVADPIDASKKALLFQLAPSDPQTSGSKRSEIAFPQNVEMTKTYWAALSVYVYDWGALPNGDVSLFGTQLHCGDNSLGLSPSFSINAPPGGRTVRIEARYSTSNSPSQGNTITSRHAEQPLPFGRWIDFVFKFREDTGSGGLLQVWMDGAPIVDRSGPLGFKTPGFKSYIKFGYYNWSTFASPRKVLLRSPTLVSDPTGSKYTSDDVRALLAQ